MSQIPPPSRRLLLTPPTLEELTEAIASEFHSRFLESSAEVCTPLDLRQPPFHLAGPAFGSEYQIKDWLKFFEADTPIVCLSVLHSGTIKTWI